MCPNCFNPYNDIYNLNQNIILGYVSFVSGTLNLSCTFIYKLLSSEPYRYVVIASVRHISSLFNTVKLIKNLKMMVFITVEYVIS